MVGLCHSPSFIRVGSFIIENCNSTLIATFVVIIAVSKVKVKKYTYIAHNTITNCLAVSLLLYVTLSKRKNYTTTRSNK